MKKNGLPADKPNYAWYQYYIYKPAISKYNSIDLGR